MLIYNEWPSYASIHVEKSMIGKMEREYQQAEERLTP